MRTSSHKPNVVLIAGQERPRSAIRNARNTRHSEDATALLSSQQGSSSNCQVIDTINYTPHI